VILLGLILLVLEVLEHQVTPMDLMEEIQHLETLLQQVVAVVDQEAELEMMEVLVVHQDEEKVQTQEIQHKLLLKKDSQMLVMETKAE
jgi:predicted RNA-binding protein